MAKLTFPKHAIICSLKEGTELVRLPHMDVAAPIKFGCCQGICGVCAIKIAQGDEHLSSKTKQEVKTLARLKLDHHRLSCQCAILGDVIVDD